jgi:hypothetical protein
VFAVGWAARQGRLTDMSLLHHVLDCCSHPRCDATRTSCYATAHLQAAIHTRYTSCHHDDTQKHAGPITSTATQ